MKFSSILNWAGIFVALSLLFIFLPRSESLGYSVGESNEKFGLIYGIYNRQGELLIAEIVINILAALLTTLVIFIVVRLLFKKLSKIVASIVLLACIVMFLIFPGSEMGSVQQDCGPSALCGGIPTDFRTYGLIGDSYRSYTSSPDVPFVYWNIIAGSLSAVGVGLLYIGLVRIKSD